jgi:hypothetical protein
MIICQNELSNLDIEKFKLYWNQNQDSVYTNWVQDNEILDRRLIIDDKSPEIEIVYKICSKYFSKIEKVWCAYQRQNFAHQIHIDDYGTDSEGFVYTFVFSLDTQPKFKTIVWKEKCFSNQKLHELVQLWGQDRTNLPKKTNISEIEDLEHTFDQNQNDYMCDYLELDGVYAYQAGSGVLFSAKQLHCTNNWTKYKDIHYRDLLQIHVISEEKIKC